MPASGSIESPVLAPSTSPRLLIAVDAFIDKHIKYLARAVPSWTVCDRLPQDAPAATYEHAMAGAEAMIGWPEPALLAKSPIKLLLLPSVGYEEYVTEEIRARNLTICNVGSVYSQGVAEHCVAMMMALARRLPEYTSAKSHRLWRHLHRHNSAGSATRAAHCPVLDCRHTTVPRLEPAPS